MEKTIVKLQKGEVFSVVVNYPTEKVDGDLYKKVDGAPNPLFGRVTRRTKYSNIRLCDYEQMSVVKAEREQGKEKRSPWYKWLNFPYIAEGKANGNKYMIVKPLPNLATKDTYYLDGVEVEFSEIERYFKAQSKYERVLAFQLDYIEMFKQGSISYERK